MPTCPGCRRRFAHGDLPMHERYCPHIWAERVGATARADGWESHLVRSVQRLDVRLADADTAARLVERVERLEERVNERLRDDE